MQLLYSSRASTSRHSSSSSGPQQRCASCSSSPPSGCHLVTHCCRSPPRCRAAVPSSVPSTSALCSASCCFARPPTPLRCRCEPAAVGCCWTDAAQLGSSCWEHCAWFLPVVSLSIECSTLFAFAIRSRCRGWCFMASFDAVCSCCLFLDTSCGWCAEQLGAVESSDLMSFSASAVNLISRAVQRSSFIHEYIQSIIYLISWLSSPRTFRQMTITCYYTLHCEPGETSVGKGEYVLMESDGIGLHRHQQATHDQNRPLDPYNDNSTCNSNATNGVNSGTYVHTPKQIQKSQKQTTRNILHRARGFYQTVTLSSNAKLVTAAFTPSYSPVASSASLARTPTA